MWRGEARQPREQALAGFIADEVLCGAASTSWRSSIFVASVCLRVRSSRRILAVLCMCEFSTTSHRCFQQGQLNSCASLLSVRSVRLLKFINASIRSQNSGFRLSVP